jgi:integrase
MAIKLRGNVWYLRRNMGGKRVEISLGVTGAENRAKAEKIATKRGDTLCMDAAVRRHQREQSQPSRFEDTAAKPATATTTFAAWADEYSRTYGKQKAATTQRRDAGTVAVWKALIGDMPMANIRPRHVLEALNTRRQATAANPDRKNPQQISESTIQRERRFLQAMFERAVENQIIERNPFKDKAIKRNGDKARHRLLTPDAEATLLAAMREPRKDATGRMVRMDERWARLVQFLVRTGLRLEELRGIDPKRDIRNGHVFVIGKGNKERAVPLTATAAKLLEDQIAADGKLWTQNQQRFREVLATAAERAKLTDPETGEPMTLSPHDLRHSFGHWWLVKGGDIYTLSQILGHQSVAVTERNYAKLTRGNIAESMNRIMG